MALLRIELLEDSEMNSGRVVNSLYSDDVYFDGFGLPFIPAWVVRNSFVKAIEDGVARLDNDDVEALVGEHANLVIDDAFIADRESMRRAILNDPFGEILLRNPQSVLDASGLTKVKKTFGLNNDTYVRMLAKGDIFESYFELDERYLDAFRQLISNMGCLFVGHEMRVRFTLDEQWTRPNFIVAPPESNWDGDLLRLEYNLGIVSHVTMLDHVSGALEAKPYIDGSMIRDALARRPELSDVFSRCERSVRCSYAYVDANGVRGLPVPASYSTKKQDKNDLRDRCSRGRRPNDFDQIKGMGPLFIDDPDNTEVHATSMRKEQAIMQYYRHGSFQSMRFRAIGPSQTCKGFIEGPRDDIRRIYESLVENGHIRIGHLSNLGFGNSFVEVVSVAPVAPAYAAPVDEITVLLASPARLYKDGLYEPSAQRVLEEIEARLGGEIELEIVRNSQKTCLVSSYNRAWGELEPIEYAMDAGSIYRLRAKDRRSFDVSALMGGIFIGGHNDVGYGETWVLPAVDAYYRHITYDDLTEANFPLTYRANPNQGRRLMRSLYQSNANALAAHLGAMRAEAYVNEDFKAGPLSQIEQMVSNDFDREQVFAAYIDALKEAGLNAMRRGSRD